MVASVQRDWWCLSCCFPILSDRVKGFIPGDGVICDLGECLTKLDGLLFQIFRAMSLYARGCQNCKWVATNVLLEGCWVKNLHQHEMCGFESK